MDARRASKRPPGKTVTDRPLGAAPDVEAVFRTETAWKAGNCSWDASNSAEETSDNVKANAGQKV